MKRTYKVRFNLARGLNYKKWKVTYPDKTYKYFDPEDCFLLMVNAKLKNNVKTSEKIFNGANKSVCAWILAENVFILKNKPQNNLGGCVELKYNPRVNPNWDELGWNVDNKEYEILTTYKNKVYS